MSTAGGLVRRGGAADRSNPWTRLPGAVRATALRRGDCFDVRPAARAQPRCDRMGFGCRGAVFGFAAAGRGTSISDRNTDGACVAAWISA